MSATSHERMTAPKITWNITNRFHEAQMQTQMFSLTMLLPWSEPTTQNHSLDQMSFQISRIFLKTVCGQSCVSLLFDGAILSSLLRSSRYSLLR